MAPLGFFLGNSVILGLEVAMAAVNNWAPTFLALVVITFCAWLVTLVVWVRAQQ